MAERRSPPQPIKATSTSVFARQTLSLSRTIRFSEQTESTANRVVELSFIIGVFSDGLGAKEKKPPAAFGRHLNHNPRARPTASVRLHCDASAPVSRYDRSLVSQESRSRRTRAASADQADWICSRR